MKKNIAALATVLNEKMRGYKATVTCSPFMSKNTEQNIASWLSISYTISIAEVRAEEWRVHMRTPIRTHVTHIMLATTISNMVLVCTTTTTNTTEAIHCFILCV